VTAFERAYTRQADTLIQWLEYPQRRLQSRMKTATGPVFALGSKGDKTKLNLFQNYRFSFDDIRGAVLHGSVLLTVTGLGVIEQTVDWSEQHVPIRALHRYAQDGAALRAMSGLEHIRELSAGRVLTWGAAAFVCDSYGSGGAWKTYEYPAQEIGPAMILDDGAECWKVVAGDRRTPMKVVRLSDGATRSIAAQFQCPNASNMVLDRRWIYVPVLEPHGGLLRAGKDEIAPR
jgi:hypothetical protein